MTYAGFEGESVLLEEIYKRGCAARGRPELACRRRHVVCVAPRPIAPWQTEAWLAEMRRSLRPNAYCA